MKKIRIYMGLICVLLFTACDPNNYLDSLYVAPTAQFDVPGTNFEVFESVVFTNKGAGQYFVVYPGDKGHVYGETGNTGFPTNSDGSFSYSYNEPGTYKVVWVASSINKEGNQEMQTASVTINIIAMNGGLDWLSIYNIYKLDEYSTGGVNVFYTSYGEFVSPDTILCPILYASWRDATINTIKAKQLVNFELSSTTSKMFWVNNGEEKGIVSMATGSRIVEFMKDNKLAIQNFRVRTASDIASDYYVAPVMMPQFTEFKINGVKGTITRSISYYEVFDIEVNLPTGTDLTQLTPDFIVMNNDINLLDGTNCRVSINGTEQISGTSSVDFSKGTVQYLIDYTMLGSNNKKLSQRGIMNITVK